MRSYVLLLFSFNFFSRRLKTTTAADRRRPPDHRWLDPPSKSLPPAWEPEVFVDLADVTPAALERGQLPPAPTWNEKEERKLRAEIREALSKIEFITVGLPGAGRKALGGGGGGGGAGGGAGLASEKGREGRGSARVGNAEEGSIEGLHDSLKLLLELITTGEEHAAANTNVIADMSDWLSNLEQKRLVSEVYRGGGE